MLIWDIHFPWRCLHFHPNGESTNRLTICNNSTKSHPMMAMEPLNVIMVKKFQHIGKMMVRKIAQMALTRMTDPVSAQLMALLPH